MSQASLIAWRNAPMTPLAATISSTIEAAPRWPARSSASPTVRSSCSRSCIAGQRDVVEDGVDDALADLGVVEDEPEGADEQEPERDEREQREVGDLRRVAVAAVVDELQRGAHAGQLDAIEQPAEAAHAA